MNVDKALRLARSTDIWPPISFYELAEVLSALADEVDRLRLEYWRATDGIFGDTDCPHEVQLSAPCDECAEEFAAFRAQKSS